jgi:hypothetical protein
MAARSNSTIGLDLAATDPPSPAVLPRHNQPLPSLKNVSRDFFGGGGGKGDSWVGCSGGGSCWQCGGSGDSIGDGGGGVGHGSKRLVMVAVVAVLVAVSVAVLVAMVVVRAVLELVRAMEVAVAVAGQWV